MGRSPDSRALTIMCKYDLPYTNKARQIKKDDFKHYDYIFGMDDENISELKELSPRDATAKILLLGDFDPEGDRIIRDPYYVSMGWDYRKELKLKVIHLFAGQRQARIREVLRTVRAML